MLGCEGSSNNSQYTKIEDCSLDLRACYHTPERNDLQSL